MVSGQRSSLALLLMVPQGRSYPLTENGSHDINFVAGHNDRHPYPSELDHVLAFNPCYHRFDQHRRKFKPKIALAFNYCY